MPTLKAVSNLFAIHNVIGKGGFAVVLLASRTPKKDAPPVQVCRGVVYGRGEVQGDAVFVHTVLAGKEGRGTGGQGRVHPTWWRASSCHAMMPYLSRSLWPWQRPD